MDPNLLAQGVTSKVKASPTGPRQTARKQMTRNADLNYNYQVIQNPGLTPIFTPKRRNASRPGHTTRPANPAEDGLKTTNQRSRPKVRKTTSRSDGNERRLRRYRNHAPQTFLERLHRISLQRMFVVGHSVNMDEPEISFDIVGSTGNIYETIIGKVPTCDCPDGKRGNQCKHICYALVFALKAPGELQFQLAFLTSELHEIWKGSPLNRIQTASVDPTDGKRKPIEGDCPICFMELEPNEKVVWCKSACGNNIHKACFDKWAATTRKSGVRCVYCRTPWKTEKPDLNIETIRKTGSVGEDGYFNVASQFGLSTQRGMSPPLYSDPSPSMILPLANTHVNE